jgi:Ca2+-binding RTX toxin-like protein
MTGDTGKDTLKGGIGNDTLNGGSNDDNLNGASGDDTLKGGLGNDLLDGGAELVYGDTASYIDRNEKIVIDLDNSGNGTVTVGISGETDTLVDIENITGSTIADEITGNDTVNTLLGMVGNDTLKGEGGADYIDGGADDDSITGGAGADILKGGFGADKFIQTVGETTGDNIDGGSQSDNSRGNDTVDYSAFIGAAGIKVSLNDTGLANVTVGSFIDDHILTNIENIIGTSGTDTIEGDTANNTLDGLSGTNDTLSFVKTSSGVFVNIGNNVVNADIDGNGSTDSVSSNQAIGTEIGTDTVKNFDDVIGGAGNDTLIGMCQIY